MKIAHQLVGVTMGKGVLLTVPSNESLHACQPKKYWSKLIPIESGVKGEDLIGSVHAHNAFGVFADAFFNEVWEYRFHPLGWVTCLGCDFFRKYTDTMQICIRICRNLYFQTLIVVFIAGVY